MNRKPALALLAASLLTVALGASAMAADRDGDTEATALHGAKLSLIDGIKAAEQHTGGQAYDAGVADKKGQVCIVVETNGPKGIQTVAIDAQSGQVVEAHPGGEAD